MKQIKTLKSLTLSGRSFDIYKEFSIQNQAALQKDFAVSYSMLVIQR